MIKLTVESLYGGGAVERFHGELEKAIANIVIDVYQCVYRCELNDWNTGTLSICDKWTKKAEWRNGKGGSRGCGSPSFFG